MGAHEKLGDQFDGETLHRGLNVRLPEEHQQQIHALLSPPKHPTEFNQHLKIGPMLVEHLSTFEGRASSGLGDHWTSDPNMAETAGAAGNVGGMPIMLTARTRKQDIETDPRRLFGSNFESESETMFQPGAQFDVTDVRIHRGTRWESVFDTQGVGTGHEAWEREYGSKYKPEEWD